MNNNEIMCTNFKNEKNNKPSFVHNTHEYLDLFGVSLNCFDNTTLKIQMLLDVFISFCDVQGTIRYRDVPVFLIIIL